MNLKLRYGLFLLLVLVLLAVFCTTAVFLLGKGHYLLTAGLLALLYFTTFSLGRKFAKIFFVLSFLRLLRQNNGSVSREKYEIFMDTGLGKRRGSEQRAQLKREVLDSLEKEGIVSIDGENILLLTP